MSFGCVWTSPRGERFDGDRLPLRKVPVDQTLVHRIGPLDHHVDGAALERRTGSRHSWKSCCFFQPCVLHENALMGVELGGDAVCNRPIAWRTERLLRDRGLDRDAAGYGAHANWLQSRSAAVVRCDFRYVIVGGPYRLRVGSS